MDVLSKILMSIDAIKAQISKSNKNHADDYYEVVAPIDEHVLKLNDQSFVTCFELRGFGKSLTAEEKKSTCRNIERELDGFLPNAGFNLQIVDFSDPDMTRKFLAESMKDSFEELENLGLNHSILTEDYLEFVAEKAVWKKQYLVVHTTSLTLDSSDKKSVKNSNQMSPEQKKTFQEQSDYIQNIMKQDSKEQGVVLTPKEKAVLGNHYIFYKEILSVFSTAGFLLRIMDTIKALKAQKMSIYGDACPDDWEPSFKGFFSKKPESDTEKGKTQVQIAPLAEQVLDVGGTEEGCPPEIMRFGERYYTTISMVIPQQDEDRLKSYRALVGKIPKEIGYISSFRLMSNPFAYSSYRTESFYAGISAFLPMSGNNLIRQAHMSLKEMHKGNEKTAVFLQFTITLFAKSVDELAVNRKTVLKSTSSWNLAKFRSVEMDKTQGLFDSLPGVSKTSNLKLVMENFGEALYQSPLFLSGTMYDRGYLHFLTEEGQPAPFEEHSSRNINYNVYISGEPGSGKSTLLTLLNLALLAKPKTNPALKGQLPIIMDVDFGKTSFGFKKLLRKIAGKKKQYLYLLKELSTDVDSAINPHDLFLGRTTPTVRQKELLTRFMLVLIGGVDKDPKSGRFLIRNANELESMIKYMIDAVYAYRQEDANPRVYQSAEFNKHKSTLKFLDSIGVKPTPDYSYWSLADLCIKSENTDRARYHATLLRRYAVPRMSDYSEILTNSPELAARYEEGVISKGQSPLRYFQERLGDVVNEFPCFSRPTRVDIDFARMISLDIKNVCGESDYRKAVFGSLCMMMYMNKRENLEESEDLMKGVSPIYHEQIKKLDKINRVLPGSFNIEEAHMLFSLFDDLLISYHRHNRKANWGMRSLSQRLQDPSDTLFSMCSTVFVTSNESGEEAERRMELIQLSGAEKDVVKRGMVNRNLFMYVKTKQTNDGFSIDRLAARLKAAVSPGLLWFSNSEQVDNDFRDMVIERLGDQEGLRVVAKYLKSGSVRGYYDGISSAPLKRIAKQKGYDGVQSLLIEEVCNPQGPSDEVLKWL